MISHKIIQNDLQQWQKEWKVKVYIYTQEGAYSEVTIKNVRIPQTQSVKYLGLHIDNKLTWKMDITKKRKQTGIKTREPVVDKKEIVEFLENKVLI